MKQLALPFADPVDSFPSDPLDWKTYRWTDRELGTELSPQAKGLFFQAEVCTWLEAAHRACVEATKRAMDVAAEFPVCRNGGVYKIDLVTIVDGSEEIARVSARQDRYATLGAVAFMLWLIAVCLVDESSLVVRSLTMIGGLVGLSLAVLLGLVSERRLDRVRKAFATVLTWIECKNHSIPLCVTHIAEVARRRDEALNRRPDRVQIFSASGFTRSALDYARRVGIECWVRSATGFCPA